MTRITPKGGARGRSLNASALAEVLALTGGRPMRRDLMIEFLHLIQDRFGHLCADHLKALAHQMGVGEAEVYEVASFYHHFDIVKDGAPPPPDLTIRVCESIACQLAGSAQLMAALEAGADPARVRVIAAPCMGRCAEAPVAVVGQNAIAPATAEAVLAAAGQGATAARQAPARDLDSYCADGGYGLFDEVRRGRRSIDSVIETISAAGLRGMGGAGFPAGRKWAIVRAFAGPKLMTVNADEGEPGTFKDRVLLESDPHRVLEGAMIAAHIVGAERIFIYLRDEYAGARAILIREIAALGAAGLLTVPIELRRGAGAYICGEESAMLESLEGNRGLPRHRPPYIAEKGLFGRPTLNHNVETLFWLREILEKGAAWFAGQGRNGARGLVCYSVSGRVRQPGVKMAPAGLTLNELIRDYCGGMAAGHRLAGYLPGGASGGILPAHLADLPLDFGALDAHGCFVGSHAVVVFSDADDPRAIARNLMAFFAAESCGQCTPCRLGTGQLLALMQAEVWDEVLMGEIEQAMRDASICGLGQAAPNPMRSILKFFKEAGQ